MIFFFCSFYPLPFVICRGLLQKLILQKVCAILYFFSIPFQNNKSLNQKARYEQDVAYVSLCEIGGNHTSSTLLALVQIASVSPQPRDQQISSSSSFGIFSVRGASSHERLERCSTCFG